MHISSRGELVNLINNSSVETFPIHSEVGTKMFNSIIEVKGRKKEKSRFYKIKWGEVLDDHDVSHLWYNPDGVEVFLNSFDWAPGWKTKQEIQAVKLAKDRLESLYQMNDCIVDNVEKNIISANPPFDKDNDSLTVMGTGPGGGKTEYASGRTARALKQGKSVLFFSTHDSEEEVKRRLIRTMTKKAIGISPKRDEVARKNAIDLIKSTELVNSDKLKIIDNTNLIDEFYIQMVMIENQNNFDLVVIDFLEMTISDDNLNNYYEVSEIHRSLDQLAKEFDCKILITTQIQDV